ncbi:thioredoxin-like protein [Vararia minispora EC-137]|uniref:Thioredoxin-like protein n=1 Tax=Vararia minispora EC-137 TaxID=1314806 RepID=A0ACB8QHA4_9AGAM|nr:thioredoxin-like protein [Vararia minispora EC-137]
MSTRQVKLVYISDYNCPWCYIGLRELQRAIQQTSGFGFQFEIEMRPFMLNHGICAIPSDCASRETYLKKKMGPERWEQCKQVVTAKGEECGINFALGGPMSDTLLAHRLTAKALEVDGRGAALKIAHPIFRAYHEDELDINDPNVLADIAQEVDLMSKEEALEFLKSDELSDKVLAQVNEARAKGVTGVPFTIIDGKWAVSGGQSAPVFVKIFSKLAQACDGSGVCTPKVHVAADNICHDAIAA